MRQLIIGIDYDGTFADDPVGWTEVIKLMEARGHKFICVTGRSKEMAGSVYEDINGLIPIVFAGKDWKKVAAERHGWKIDIWIDDMPSSVEKQHLFLSDSK